MPRLVFLWTDVLLWTLVAIAVFYAVYSSRHEHLRAPWRQVVRSRLAMCSAVVLGVYLAIGLVDSIHFNPRLQTGDGAAQPRYATEVLSLFDVLVGSLRTRDEKTYSAPLATRLFAKEVVELPDGRETREFPRLQFGGRHLADPDRDRLPDIFATVLKAGSVSMLAWSAVTGLLLLWLARRAGRGVTEQARLVARGQTQIPWRAMLLTLAALVLIGGVAAGLASKYHVLGTDKVGQDVLYQGLKSVRTGLMIGTLTTLVMLPFAIMLGVTAGYFGGLVDDVIQYLYTTLNSIPGVLLIAAAVLMLEVYMAKHAEDFTSLVARADLRLLFLCMILGVTSWTTLCRLLRGEALKLRESDYIQAAQALGVRHANILRRHIVPNVMHIVLIAIVLDFSGLVLAEAVLSYIKIGVDPTMNSWGNMINSARLEMAREPVVWWSLAAAFAFMFVLVLAANLFSDTVRDAFDPRVRAD